jgi:ElaB/YqjD/DUF883 family membrane-anchored ribosome-binding protein
MDSTTTPTPSRGRDADIAAATTHLKESWELAREGAEDARRVARKTWHDVSRGVDQFVEARHWAVALGALGTGLAIGLLTGLLVSRGGRGTSTV